MYPMKPYGILQSINQKFIKTLSCGSLVTYRSMRFIDQNTSLGSIGDAKTYSGAWISDWDQPYERSKELRSVNQEQSNTPINKLTVRRNIFLIRHGQYSNEQECAGHLNDRGRTQAGLTGRRLLDLGISWDCVATSTMPRALETAMIILKQIKFDPRKLEHCDLLCEGTPYPADPPQKGSKEQIEEAYMHDGPRIKKAFRRYFFRPPADQTKDSYMLIIAHSNVLRYLILRALQLPPKAWTRLTLYHGSITWLTIATSGRVSLRCLGDTGYMPVDEVTFKKPKKVNSV